MLVVEQLSDTFKFLYDVRPDGTPNLIEVSKAELVWRHEVLAGYGNEVAWVTT